MGLTLHAERPGTDYDDAWWAAVHALYEEAFPGLPAGIARAAHIGVHWRDRTTPFALFEGERCVAHVGVIRHPMWLGGERLELAGVHAVCTAEDRRKRGLCRQVMEAALAWADPRHTLAKLSTDDPGVYTGRGFRSQPTWRFRSERIDPIPSERRLLRPSESPADRALLTELLAHRTPVSTHCATAWDGWLLLLDAALYGNLDTVFWYLPAHHAVVVADRLDTHPRVLEVIAADLPSAGIVAGVALQEPGPLAWSFLPDAFDASAVAERMPPSAGTFMVRGRWPELGEFGLSPLWEH